MIEVFKTDVQNKQQAKTVIGLLKNSFSEADINFDLSACDKILRVEAANLYSLAVVHDVMALGLKCEILN